MSFSKPGSLPLEKSVVSGRIPTPTTFLIPRGLSRTQSAMYIGISPSLFDQLVDDGRMPKPKRINARTVWDRVQLDEAFTALSDDDAQVNEWDGL